MAKDELFTEEELEEKADERRDREVIKALDDMVSRYKSLFGNDPDTTLPVAEIQAQIRDEMIRRDLRPYKL